MRWVTLGTPDLCRFDISITKSIACGEQLIPRTLGPKWYRLDWHGAQAMSQPLSKVLHEHKVNLKAIPWSHVSDTPLSHHEPCLGLSCETCKVLQISSRLAWIYGRAAGQIALCLKFMELTLETDLDRKKWLAIPCTCLDVGKGCE